MKQFKIIILAFFSLVACKAQEKSTEIIDPVTPARYKVIRDNPYVSLPDTLGGDEYKGFAFVEGKIVDSTLCVIDVQIMKMKLQTKEGTDYIDYYYGIDSISNKADVYKAKRYLPFFVEYLNTLQIERVKGIDQNGGNVITLPIRFK